VEQARAEDARKDIVLNQQNMRWECETNND
jgi:hypothetical protein